MSEILASPSLLIAFELSLQISCCPHFFKKKNSCCLLFFSFPFFFDKMFPKALIAQEGVTGDMVYEKAKSTTASLEK